MILSTRDRAEGAGIRAFDGEGRDGVTAAVERSAIVDAASSAYVAAGPGTGKTRLLVERYCVLRAAGVAAAQILVLTFSRRAVQELRERLVAAGVPPHELDVRTFHGFAARVAGGGLARFRDGRLLDGFSRTLLLETALEATATPTLPDVVRTSERFRDELSRLLDDLGRVPHFTDREDASPRVRDLLAILDRLRAERAAAGGRDLGDLVGRAVAELRRSGSPAQRWTANRYAHVLIDEFQDTDRPQLELLALLREHGATLFAVGDEAQSIYRFRGAGFGIVADAVRRFGMETFALDVSRRCPPDVCALASAAPIPALRRLVSSQTVGEPVRVVRLRRPDDEVTFLADEIEASIDGGVEPREIAVLLRAFRPIGPLLVDELRRRGVPVASTGREELLADPRVGALRAALDVLDEPSNPQRWTRFLTAPALGYDALALRFGPREPAAALRLDEALPATLERICAGGVVTGRAAGEALLAAAQSWDAGELGAAARRLARRLGLVAAILRDEPPLAVRAAGARLKLVCDALRDVQRTARALGVDASCRAVVRRFDDLFPALALDDAGLDPAAPGVRVLTVHAAKGLEFERVFVADAVNGRFPQAPRPSTLLDDDERAWLAARGADGVGITGDAALEEASLWYVAVTRAKTLLTITFSGETLDGTPAAPSRFIPPERLPSGTRGVQRESLVSRALRTGDRTVRARLLASGALAAAPALAAYAEEGADAFAPLEPRPLRLEGRLRVGDVERWLRCPRRVFYQRFAGLDGPESEALEIGSLVHAVLQRFHEKHADFRSGAVDVDGWTRELHALRDELWNPDDFASPVVATAAARAAGMLLAGYARLLAKDAAARRFVVEEREVRVVVRVGPHELSGRIDRVDRDAGGSRTIVDYKKGAAKKPALLGAMRDALDEPRLAGTSPSELVAQLPLYATAFEDAGAVAYVYLGGEKAVERRDGAVLDVTPFGDEARRFVERLVAELRSDLLDPLAEGRLTTLGVAAKAETCTFCPYTRVCPGPEER